MDSAILQMLDEYGCQSASDYENALKEIMQEIALLGLWRVKFYEHALFYGGSCLRILYGLPRFSEDLDFSLLRTNLDFDLSKYYAAIVAELEGFGFEVEIKTKNRTVDSQIDSAFIKAGTRINFIKIKVPDRLLARLHSNQILKIKIEVDLDPPGNHGVEVKDIFRPIPFQVKTMPLADLFAGKIHAILARKWQTRVKGRDYYDYLWYLGRKSALNLKHLEARLLQSGHFNGPLTIDIFQAMLSRKFQEVDIEKAKMDIAPFLNDREKAALDLWSNDYFMKTVKSIQCSP
ncbi:MAG: nucleotidyl transferase AbiEii/AbiGii toxin family protein [Desulfobacterales bacterium]|nr:nucleotidyl transferase AbiEii/AbiGii toxin family protein [Desulfobacterales bacterium]